MLFGLDISHHQDLALDLARCKREGISFVFLKATEGSGFVDGEFSANLAEARGAGLLVAAYHYVRSAPSAVAQVAHIQKVIPRDVPVILDVEAGSGGVALVRDLVGRLQQAGYRVPLLYLPRWYWQQIGSPSLAGLPPLWSSRYPDRVVGSIADEWADVPAHYWNGYGGLGVAVLQFTSSAAIAGHQPLDANAYRGSTAELAALLGGASNGEDLDEMDSKTFQDNVFDALVNLANDAAAGNPALTKANAFATSLRAILAPSFAAIKLDVDESELAGHLAAPLIAALEADGATGLTVDQLEAAMRRVLGQTHLTVRQDAIEGSNT